LRTPRDEPKLSEVFRAYILARNAGVEEDFVDQLFNSSEKPLARVLLLMASFGKEGKPEPAIPKFSQETLAEIVGAHAVARERVHQSISGVRLRRQEHNSLLNVILHDRRPDGRGSDGK
jgi:CRP/FNR family transcriptional regulator, cyclic AMP receptor protein